VQKTGKYDWRTAAAKNEVTRECNRWNASTGRLQGPIDEIISISAEITRRGFLSKAAGIALLAPPFSLAAPKPALADSGKALDASKASSALRAAVVALRESHAGRSGTRA